MHCIDGSKPKAIAHRVLPIRKAWLPRSVVRGEVSLVEWLRQALDFWDGVTGPLNRRHSFSFRGHTWNNTRLMHLHFFGRNGKFPGAHRHRQGVIRSLANSIHIAAFYDRIQRPGPTYMKPTWTQQATRLAQATQVILKHKSIANSWYYIWCVIDGIGMRHWFPGAIPPVNGGGPVGPFPSPF